MAATTRVLSASAVQDMMVKLGDSDSDIRFMTLIDLGTLLTSGPPTMVLSDYSVCARAVDWLVRLLNDSNGDVQSQALKCLGPLAARCPADILPPFIDKLSNIDTSKSLDSSLPCTATKSLLVSLPRPVMGVTPTKGAQDGYAAISRVLIPRLLGYIVIPHGQLGLPAPGIGMLDIHPAMGADINAIDLLHETIRCYGPMLQDAEKEALQKKLLDILDDRRTGIVGKKKAVASVSILAVYLTDSLLANFISSLTESFGAEDIPHAQRRLLISLSGSVARSIPRRFGAYLEKLAPFILCAIGKEEYDVAMDFYDEDEGVTSADDEVREAAFIALEDFLASCSEDMRPFTDEVIESSLRYLRYDPSLAQQEDEEEIGGDDNGDEDDGEHGDLEEDDDFEQEVGMSDGDDASWKIRRCAAKVLHTIIDTQGTGDLLENGTLFDKVAPVLIKCFKEREDHVRLEVIAALSALVKITGNSTPGLDAPTFIDDDIYGSPAFVIKSRKRRRGGSDASMFDTHSPVKGTMSPVEPFSPTSGARADLARLSPQIIRATVNLLKHSSIPTKQAAVILLKDFVHMQNGGLNENMAQVIEPTMEIIKTPTVLAGASAVISISGAGSATGNSLRIEALQLLGTVCDTHSSRFIAPYMPTVTPALIQAVNDKYFKISAEAIIVAESVVNVLTPPRSAGRDAQFKSDLGKIFDIIVDKARANDTDLEVRQRAIHALGTGLSRTCGENRLISSSKRSHALGILQDRLRNETTRLASVQAIDIVALSSFDQDGLKNDWVQIVTLELANQLRKADRTLRGSSLAALKHLIANTTVLEQLDDETVKKLVDLLMPLVDAKNLVLLGMALDVLSELAKRSPITVVNEDLNSSLCRIVATPLAGHILEAFLAFVATIGLQNVGQPLMHALLQRVGVTGDPAIVGAAIGTLLVSGGSSVGVGIDDIIKELQTAQDDDRKCLALSILGEAGLKLGAASPMQPAIFLDYFKSKSDKVPRAAAMALGRAGAGNIPLYLPIIMSNLTKSGNTQFLLLHSIKEILLHASIARTSIASSTDEIWSMLLGVSELEDNKAIGAECIGRLISIEPKKYLPVLQQYLQGSDPSIRGMVIQAIRFALSDSDETFTDVLKPMLIPLLKTMLNDSVLENRRLALTSLNSATSNKAALILPYISSLLPLVIRESVVNPDLVREVQMGPFKIKVDDGLENRKSAYETLHVLMDTAFSRMNHADIFDRVVAGLRDEHDIKMLCNLMLSKLIILDPDETIRRLDTISECYKATLSVKLKDNAVKQEIEKANDASKDALRVSVRLQAAFQAAANTVGPTQAQGWRSYWDWVGKDFKNQLQAAEADVKSQG